MGQGSEVIIGAVTALNLISFLGLFVLGGLAWVVGGLQRPVAENQRLS